ncbi:MAG: RNA 2'-phosphotransferase [Nitrososphaeria archaeon]|nr:RNA 2'-phosphotransferase [Nitrososphaeria archaeon]
MSRYASYLLRHNHQDLEMDRQGFVSLERLLDKIQKRFSVDKKLIVEALEGSDRRRFEIVRHRIRALYGHTIPVELELKEDKTVQKLYHGTTSDAACGILRRGLRPMKRQWVHLSPNIELAVLVGLRRTPNPVVLQIDAEAARKGGVIFYRATNAVYLSANIEPEYVRRVS